MFGQRVPDSDTFRQSFGQAVLDEIRRRTASNIGRTGKRFRNYSDEYADSLEFEAAGKSQNDPNLRLTGDMLGLMNVVATDRNSITLGWNQTDEAAKAHGHITGSVGVTRDFFGLPDNVYNSLKSRFTIPEEFSLGELVAEVAFTTLIEQFGEGAEENGV